MNEKVVDERLLGEIYKLTCKTSGKSYIGQALKRVSGNTKWGSIGRFKSHITEAYKSDNDHCTILNNAIRKYGKDDFILEVLKDNVPIEQLDNLEIELIEKYNTMVPNGYNIRSGGANGKITSEARIEKRLKRTNYTLIRSYEEDKDLPLFLSAKRCDNKIIGYRVDFPVPNEDRKILKEFINSRLSEKELYNQALDFLNNLKKEHNFDDSNLNVNVIIKNRVKPKSTVLENSNIDQSHDSNEEQLLENFMERKIEKKKKDLPEYITPVYAKTRLIGYAVENYPDHTGKPYETKQFTELSSNVKHLKAAKRYIKELEIRNKDAVFKEYIPDELKELQNTGFNNSFKRSDNTNHLPKYLAHVIVDGKKIGYQINNFPLSKDNKAKKKYCDTTQTMEEKYKLAIDHLIKLWIQKNNIESESETNSDND